MSHLGGDAQLRSSTELIDVSIVLQAASSTMPPLDRTTPPLDMHDAASGQNVASRLDRTTSLVSLSKAFARLDGSDVTLTSARLKCQTS
jgi:hypothetical protein